MENILQALELSMFFSVATAQTQRQISSPPSDQSQIVLKCLKSKAPSLAVLPLPVATASLWHSKIMRSMGELALEPTRAVQSCAYMEMKIDS
jgi:hypothetical protein